MYPFGGQVTRLTRQEAIELHEKSEIDVVALRRSAVAASHMVLVEIDT